MVPREMTGRRCAVGFRYKKGIRVGYNQQGWIYFHCLQYKRLPRREQEKIRKHCREVGGEYAAALLEFVTSEKGYSGICMKHDLSTATLYRLVKKFYEGFPSG